MTEVLAWVWTPLVLYAVFFGLGLVTDRVSGARVPDPLLAPLGLVIAVVLATPLFRFGFSASVVLATLAIAAAGGLVLARRSLRERFTQPTALCAAAAVYLLYLAPVAFSGDATWGGYNFLNDTAGNFILIDLLEHRGVEAPAEVSAYASTGRYFATSGYPIGAHAVVAALRPLTGASVEAVYQPFLALVAALTAIPLAEIVRRAGLRSVSAGVAAVLAMGGVLIYRYSLQGSIKEVMLTAFCATAAALAVVALERRLPTRVIVLIALCCLAMVLAFSAAAGAYALAFAVVVVIAAIVAPEGPDWRHLLRLAAVAAGASFLVLVPMLGATLDFAQVVTDVFSSGGDVQDKLGHLARPLPLPEAAGVWLARDYRFAVFGALGDLNFALVAAAVLLAALGAAVAIARRRPGPLILFGAVALPTAALAPLVSPYIDAKLLATLTPAVVLLAAFGVLALLEKGSTPVRVAGTVGLVALAAGVFGSDLLGYRENKLAPLDRMAAMEDAADHADGNRLWLLNEWEEFGKYFMRSVRINPAAEPRAPKPLQLRVKAATFGLWHDLDRQELSYVQGFSGIVLRRSPEASRPPASFRRVYRNRYYELWRRDTGVKVLRHMPLQARYRSNFPASCQALAKMAREARSGDRLLAARPARTPSLSALQAKRPESWTPSATPGTVQPTGPGTMSGDITTRAGGRTRVWLHGTTGRPLTAVVDGRRVGEMGQINSPGQWLEAGTVSLSPGTHRVEIRRSGASAAPGDGFRGELGPVVLQSAKEPELVSVPPRDARRLCGKSWDWIELVRS